MQGFCLYFCTLICIVYMRLSSSSLHGRVYFCMFIRMIVCMQVYIFVILYVYTHDCLHASVYFVFLYTYMQCLHAPLILLLHWCLYFCNFVHLYAMFGWASDLPLACKCCIFLFFCTLICNVCMHLSSSFCINELCFSFFLCLYAIALMNYVFVFVMFVCNICTRLCRFISLYFCMVI